MSATFSLYVSRNVTYPDIYKHYKQPHSCNWEYLHWQLHAENIKTHLSTSCTPLFTIMLSFWDLRPFLQDDNHFGCMSVLTSPTTYMCDKCKNLISLKLTVRVTDIALKLQISFCQDSWQNKGERPDDWSEMIFKFIELHYVEWNNSSHPSWIAENISHQM